MPTLVLHMMNEDPVVGEVDILPVKTDTMIFLTHPRRRDGRVLPYLDENVKTAAWPISRLSFFEIIPEVVEEEDSQETRGKTW
jgi:hypothetical protein